MDRTAHISELEGSSRPRSRRLLALRSDAHLVALVRAGEEAAFEVLYDRHVAKILSFCSHMLGSRVEAEDAAQQAFISAYRALSRDDREMAFKAWLYTIARNTCLSILRARREQPDELPEIATVALEQEVEQRADLRRLVSDLQDLPEEQRAALVLTELGDLSHAQVADVLGCDVKAVKGVVFRARSGLIERRDAAQADCEEIREELAVARGGALRKGRLKHHLRGCSGCRAYLEDVRQQRMQLAVVLPVIPTIALKDGVMAAIGITSATTATTGAVGALGAGGAATAAGTSAIGGVAAKVAIVGVLAGGGVVVADTVRKDEPVDPVREPAAGEASKGPGSSPSSGGAVPPGLDVRRSPRKGRSQAAKRGRPDAQRRGPKAGKGRPERAPGKGRGGSQRAKSRGNPAPSRGKGTPRRGGRSEAAPFALGKPEAPRGGGQERPPVTLPESSGDRAASPPKGRQEQDPPPVVLPELDGLSD